MTSVKLEPGRGCLLSECILRDPPPGPLCFYVRQAAFSRSPASDKCCPFVQYQYIMNLAPPPRSLAFFFPARQKKPEALSQLDTSQSDLMVLDADLWIVRERGEHCSSNECIYKVCKGVVCLVLG